MSDFYYQLGEGVYLKQSGGSIYVNSTKGGSIYVNGQRGDGLKSMIQNKWKKLKGIGKDVFDDAKERAKEELKRKGNEIKAEGKRKLKQSVQEMRNTAINTGNELKEKYSDSAKEVIGLGIEKERKRKKRVLSQAQLEALERGRAQRALNIAEKRNFQD